ncbi:MAG: class I SAM-dependent methyltransferase [Oscillospiraceae bacterium]|jgi:ubiquinone/menaquinone biosynthesis C-methylase UbiE|nr:class I SAM-dependent methyltransferase [Oscillospiraceae bacterium]
MAYMKNARRKKDLGINGFMARWYDRNTRKSRLAEMSELADTVAGSADPGAKILEAAPGPGYLSIELARRGFDVVGVELSRDFVAIEKRNASEAGVRVDFRQGNADALPLADGEVDFIICSAAFKNFSQPLKALREMHRVLRPGGTALICDMNHEATREDIEGELNKTGMKGFDRWFVKLSFQTFLKSGAYTRAGFEELIVQTDFARHEIIKSGIGFGVWLYKAAA